MKMFYSDLEQAESRAVGAYCFTIFGESGYLDATESGDLHSLVCAMCWRDLPWPEEFSLQTVQKYGKLPEELLKAAKAVAETPAYRDKTYRDLAKILGHGSNYFGKPPTMSKHAHVEKRLVEDFQRRYFGAFPEIPMFHKWVLQQLQLGGELKTLAGRKRIFFGRPDDDKTLREAIAYLAQSFATGDYINIGILDLWKKKLPLWIVSQVHDAAAGYYNEDQEEMILREVKDSLEHRMELRSPNGNLREFFIPTETKVGWNMGYFDEERNPFGLMKIGEGGDPRKRKKQLPRRKKKKIDLSMRIGNVG